MTITEEQRKEFGLPPMTVFQELEETAQDHGLRAPSQIGTPEYQEEIEDMLKLVKGARVTIKKDQYRLDPFSDEVTDTLNKYLPEGHHNIDAEEYLTTLENFGFSSWAALVEFVKDDDCIELFTRINHWAKDNNIKHKEDRPFISDEVGQYSRLADRMERTLKKVGEVKWFFKHVRPLEYFCMITGCDMRAAINYMHPGHWECPAGHGGKFGEILQFCRSQWTLTPAQDFLIFLICFAASMARSGGGVHKPHSNLMSWPLAGVKEFNRYLKAA